MPCNRTQFARVLAVVSLSSASTAYARGRRRLQRVRAGDSDTPLVRGVDRSLRSAPVRRALFSSRIYALYYVAMSAVDVPQSASLYRHLEKRDFAAAYEIAYVALGQHRRLTPRSFLFPPRQVPWSHRLGLATIGP